MWCLHPRNQWDASIKSSILSTWFVALLVLPGSDLSDGRIWDTEGCDQELFGNGECDGVNNNDECSYDGGDCCPCSCADANHEKLCGLSGYDCIDPEGSTCEETNATPYPDCLGVISNIGNGWCDASNNVVGCSWDGGDCCPCTCHATDDYHCDHENLDCIDPDAWCSDSDPSSTSSDRHIKPRRHLTTYVGCQENSSLSGDGHCDESNNVSACDYDGGDCCPDSCIASSGCGENG